MRNPNRNILLLLSASRTTLTDPIPVLNDEPNFHSGIQLIIDVTVAGTGSITVEIDGVDSITGKTYSILASAAITTISTVVLTVFKGAPVTTNVSANSFLPANYQIKVTHNNANAMTYSITANTTAL